MTTIFFGPPVAAQEAQQETARQGGARPVAPICCSAIVVCHLVDRRRVTKP
ncbi:hypothetical protein [Methylobacterium sp. SyP6R]|uniref:hypothetical protein n=1 Tax=Methylobacterium sp. SyP6R TaxID=2718876 RepID=UPI001F45CCE7|nr:hypothetical protein [Methylobacterium sp. SyP6R]MCF4129087.1 hypothetical protein [Methylobacterium sp. SyP6R]